MPAHRDDSPQPDESPQGSRAAFDDATRFVVASEDGSESGFDAADEFEMSEHTVVGDVGPIAVLGEYLLLEQIGAGGMGRVYRAEHRTMNRQVALKILSRDIASHPGLLEQFFSEVRAVAKLMHPNIVTAFDAGSIDDKHFLVMELVQGEVLSERLHRAGPLSSGEVAHVIEQAAAALGYAHRQGIVHRDIKPSNLMLTVDGTLKILDFGLARLGNAPQGIANRKIFMGTPEYMSPEQIENAEQVDGRSDLYSLGATMFYLLTGQPMFRGDKMQVAVAQLRQKPEPLYMVRSDVDLRLDSIFQKLVAKAPADRYPTAAALLEDIAVLNLSSVSPRPGLFHRGAGRLAGDQPTSDMLGQSTLAKKSHVVAIDLGMLVSTVAHFDPNLGPQIIPQGDGNMQHLRNMLWSAGSEIKIGVEAQALRQHHPEQVLQNLQRWIGMSQVDWSLVGQRPPPEVLLAVLLRQLMSSALKATDGSQHAIVTVPGCYDQMHRRAIRNACRIAGIRLVQLLDKPLAAALAWLDVNSRLSTVGSTHAAVNSKLLFVHLGGTGLEASVLHASGLEVVQLGVCGSWKFGSLRWQNRLTEYFVGRLKEVTGRSVKDDLPASTRLQRTVELALDRLTRSSRVEVRFEWEGASIEQTITQDGLVKLAPELCQVIEDTIRQACVQAKTDVDEIDHILLAGSLMKMGPIQQLVKRCVPHRAAVTELEKADLARGAAIQSQHFNSLSLNKNLLPRGIGCMAYDVALLAADTATGKVVPRILLERSTPLPASLTRTLRPKSLAGGTPAMSFPPLQIIESSSLGSSHWLALGKVQPDVLFPERGAGEPLQLRVEVDDSGILETSLVWSEGKRQVRLPHTSDPTLSDADLDHWQSWLETTMLVANLGPTS
jgi:serine/threonine protein kinase